MRFRLLEIRRRIKSKSQTLLMRSLMPAVKLCLLLTAIYCVVFYIQLYASPVLEVNGQGISAVIDAYLHMDLKQLLLIVAINIFVILVVGPLMCCACAFFIKITDEKGQIDSDRTYFQNNNEIKISHFLQWFSKSSLRSKAIRLRFATSILSVLWHIVFVGPPLILIYFLRGNPNSLKFANRLFIYTTWLLIGFLATYIKLGSYYPAYFLVAQYPNMSITEALRDSAKMMRGHALEFFRYKLSFLPWYALCVLTFGLGLIYVVPYRLTCDAMFVRYIDSVSAGGDVP